MIPVVISGGSGTRLWPISRKSFPKQFCQFLEDSLQTKALGRLLPFGEPWVLTVGSLKTLTQLCLKDLDLPEGNAIYEPFGRNTAPAIALACRFFAMQGRQDEILGIFPADQLIQDEETFAKNLKLAIACAEKGEIVTLGVQPTYPATGYGYIEVENEVFLAGEASGAKASKRFCEKPDVSTAKEFLQQGNYLWNAGMFVFRVSEMIKRFEEFQPELWQKVTLIKDDLSNVEDVYKSLPSISIDYAIMENLSRLICVPSDIGWSDVGSWEELFKVLPEKESKHVSNVDGGKNFLYPQKGKAYGLIDTDNLIVVDTPDALLISKAGSSQKVKDVVDQLSAAEISQATEHVFDIRPWGRYDILADEKEFKAKVIEVNAGQRISYQSHEKRSEHWVVVAGSGMVTLDDQEKPVKAGDYIFIPQKSKHRISADQKSNLKFVEVQTGEYFGEDDITRYSDDYQRS